MIRSYFAGSACHDLTSRHSSPFGGWFAQIFICLSVFPVTARTTFAEQPASPNVILIMADDLGWMDLHCQGNQQLETPALDKLATEGVRFTSAYAAAPVCSPTRAALMTGKAPARLGINNHISGRDFVPDGAQWLPAENVTHLDTSEVTLAEELLEKGYRTAFFGKWHLAGVPGRGGVGKPEFYPEKQGFQLNLGGCAHGGPPTFFDPYGIHNLPNRKEGEYLPDRLMDEVLDYIGERVEEEAPAKQRSPFFVTLWNYTVHWPMEAPAELVGKYEKRVGPGIKDARYAAMIEAMDRSYGRLFEFLDEQQLRDNTLVIFTSDNGAYGGVADSRPLRASKGYLYEGGIRVPLIIRWPAVAKVADGVGRVVDTPVITMDLHATIRDAVGLSGSSLDGQSLRTTLAGKQDAELSPRSLFFHYPCYAWHRDNRLGSAIRAGDFKLIEWVGAGDGKLSAESSNGEFVELYDLSTDISERTNLVASKPGVTKDLRDQLSAWRAATGAAMPRRAE